MFHPKEVDGGFTLRWVFHPTWINIPILCNSDGLKGDGEAGSLPEVAEKLVSCIM